MAKRLSVVLAVVLATGCSLRASPGQEPVHSQPAPLGFSNPQQEHVTPAPATVTLIRDTGSLRVHFKVATATVFAKPRLASSEYPYEYDVVEVFLRNAQSPVPGYFEFEVSPYNQALQVNIIEPRQEYHFGVRNGFTHSATMTADGWEAEMKIPLASIGWDGHSPLQLVGNAYAALGEGERRIYWSLFELPAGKPDFHVPSAFRPLFQ
jgi:hypothetical protein